MEDLAAWAILAPIGLLLGFGLIADRWASRLPRILAGVILGLTAGTFVAGAAAAWLVVPDRALELNLLSASTPRPLSLGIYVDSLSALMLLLISFLGLIVTQYARYYLAGEEGQGRFFRWLAFTLGAVLLLVVARNLLLFLAAWVLTSLGLHQLLVYYQGRAAAVWAARKKFVISRLGDLALLAAVILVYRYYGTLDYPDLVARIAALQEAEGGGLAATPVLIGLLLAFTAMAKSAQLPLHSWLPETMETPTPVSALMHAGIINAGGYLLVRFSPLLIQSPPALYLLIGVGMTTAIFGALVMATETSNKRALAYSTIAQMGFMILQCGLGAFAGAMLHMIAHSLYKSHAFLSAGSLLQDSPAIGAEGRRSRPWVVTAAGLGLGGLVTWAVIAGLGINLSIKPGSLVQCVVLVFAAGLMMEAVLRSRTWAEAGRHLSLAVALPTAYFLLLRGAILWLGPAVEKSVPISMATSGVFAAVLAFALLVLAMQSAKTPATAQGPLASALYVHARNGFYLDLAAHRLVRQIWHRRRTPAV